jgi:phosphoribosylformimino-5-aminoimidazole carboxamide ribotide isomerase
MIEIIPVMDVLNGIVVHAVRGEREKYKPIKSILSKYLIIKIIYY